MNNPKNSTFVLQYKKIQCIFQIIFIIIEFENDRTTPNIRRLFITSSYFRFVEALMLN